MVNSSGGICVSNHVSLVSLLEYLEVFFCLATVCAIVFRRQWSDYWALGSMLSVRIASGAILVPLQFMATNHYISKKLAYNIYFYSYWLSYAIEAVLALMVVYGIFRLAMAPLKGLQTLGTLVFRWAAVISVTVAMLSAILPSPAAQQVHITSTNVLISAIQQLQRTQSILTLCLLMFVCFAVRPMGLSYSSRIFGVGLGLGVMSATSLVQAAWLVTPFKMMSSNVELVNGISICVTLAIWAGYFMVPEPKRRIIVLPTTSPFLRWNQISQALGDNPGFVAVGGIPPEVFAPAELEIMSRASAKMVTPFPKSLGA
jgi:hypothetical protein